MCDNAVVVVEGLTFSYGMGEVVHKISFTLRRGEVVGLLGPNGAGKSTTLKVLTGVLPPGADRFGLPICSARAGRRGQEAHRLCAEAAGLFESLTGQEFLELMGRLQACLKSACSFESRDSGAVRLRDDRLRPLDGYSKGMRQKVLLSAALLHNPDLVLLTSPSLASTSTRDSWFEISSLPWQRREDHPSTARMCSTWWSEYAIGC